MLNNLDLILCSVPITKNLEKFNGPFLMIKAELSNFVTADEFEYIKNFFPNANLKTIKKSNHYLNKNANLEMVELIFSFLD